MVYHHEWPKGRAHGEQSCCADKKLPMSFLTSKIWEKSQTTPFLLTAKYTLKVYLNIQIQAA
jgi:hypothetical protein